MKMRLKDEQISIDSMTPTEISATVKLDPKVTIYYTFDRLSGKTIRALQTGMTGRKASRLSFFEQPVKEYLVGKGFIVEGSAIQWTSEQ
jgi:hypothetical protein